MLRNSVSCNNKNELRKWFRVRDLLLGDNNTLRNVEEAFRLAKSCQHKDAIWLSQQQLQEFIFMNTLRSLNDHRANAFEVFLFFDKNKICLQTEALGGYPFAQALYAEYLFKYHTCRGDLSKCIDLAYKAIENGSEPRAYYILGELGRTLLYGTKPPDSGYYYKRAAKLGYVKAYFHCLTYSTSKKYRYWICMAAMEGINIEFFKPCLAECYIGDENLYYIAKAIQTTTDAKKLAILNIDDKLIKHMHSLFNYTHDIAKRAIDTWSLIAHRNHVLKDLRLLVAKRLWKKRSCWAVLYK